jgi:hypothetical protein
MYLNFDPIFCNKKNKNKKSNQRSKVQIYSFKTANKNENKIEHQTCELLKTTPIPIDVDDDDYFTQINTNLERKKRFANNNINAFTVNSNQISVDKSEKELSLNNKSSLDFEQLNGLDENGKSQVSSFTEASTEVALEKVSINQETNNNTINSSSHYNKNVSFKNDISQINALTIELNSKNQIESSYSNTLNDLNNNNNNNNKENFPFGAKFFEIHGEYNL